jgi:hypothetical protein
MGDIDIRYAVYGGSCHFLPPRGIYPPLRNHGGNGALRLGALNLNGAMTARDRHSIDPGSRSLGLI